MPPIFCDHLRRQITRLCRRFLTPPRRSLLKVPCHPQWDAAPPVYCGASPKVIRRSLRRYRVSDRNLQAASRRSETRFGFMDPSAPPGEASIHLSTGGIIYLFHQEGKQVKCSHHASMWQIVKNFILLFIVTLSSCGARGTLTSDSEEGRSSLRFIIRCSEGQTGRGVLVISQSVM